MEILLVRLLRCSSKQFISFERSHVLYYSVMHSFPWTGSASEEMLCDPVEVCTADATPQALVPRSSLPPTLSCSHPSPLQVTNTLYLSTYPRLKGSCRKPSSVGGASGTTIVTRQSAET